MSSEGKFLSQGWGVLPVVELCLYSLALSGYPTLPMSEREKEGEIVGGRDGRGGGEKEGHRFVGGGREGGIESERTD